MFTENQIAGFLFFFFTNIINHTILVCLFVLQTIHPIILEKEINLHVIWHFIVVAKIFIDWTFTLFQDM